MSRRSTTRFRTLALAAVCAASLGIAACGDDDDDDTTATTVPTGATGAPETGDTETSETEGNFADAIRTQLEAAGVESSAADCVVDELESTVSEEEITEAEEAVASGGVFPQDLLDASIEAAQSCIGE